MRAWTWGAPSATKGSVANRPSGAGEESTASSYHSPQPRPSRVRSSMRAGRGLERDQVTAASVKVRVEISCVVVPGRAAISTDHRLTPEVGPAPRAGPARGGPGEGSGGTGSPPQA